MKPKRSELKAANRALSEGAEKAYLRVLMLSLQQYQRMDPTDQERSVAIGYLRSRSFRHLFSWADSLASRTYANHRSHYDANQIALLIRKYPWDRALIGTDPERAAVQKFDQSERKCRLMNKKMRLLDSLRNPRSEMSDLIRSTLVSWMGSTPNMKRIYEKCDFGDGASLGVHGNRTHIGRKLSVDKMTVTPCCVALALSGLKRNFHYCYKLFPVRGGFLSFDVQQMEANYADRLMMVQHNKIEFVPKTARTHRAIAVEPLLNGFVQKGIDLELRNKLLRIGIDLRDQSKNQEMAREGSLPDSEDPFCTIDLSSASDSISIGLAKHLLPRRWFDLLNITRSPSYVHGSQAPRRYEKFCSMGNGFCFPLQTLLFAAIAKACGAGSPGVDFRVYGDDIIVRRSIFDEVISALRFYGFTPNVDKTFGDGPFRESCGADWYNGLDVRPFTLDFRLDSVSSVFKFLNLSRRNNLYPRVLDDAISFVLNEVLPDRFRFVRPFSGPPDTAIDPFDQVEYYMEPSYLGFSRKLWAPTWYELLAVGVGDSARYEDNVVMAGFLRGGRNIGPNFDHPFSVRRKSRLVVRKVARAC